MGLDSEKLKNRLSDLAVSLEKNIYVRAVRDSFLALAPVTYVSSFALVLKQILHLLSIEAFDVWLDFAWRFGLGMISLYICIVLSYKIAKLKKEEPFSYIFLSVFGLFAFCVLPYMDLVSLSGRNLFVVICICILTDLLYSILKKVKERAYLPYFRETVIVFVYLILSYLLRKLPFSFDPVLKFLDEGSDSLLFVIAMTIFLHVVWFFGIHDSAFGGILAPIREGHLSINGLAMMQNGALPYVFTTPFWVYFVIIGGCGSLFSLVILLCFSKSESLRKAGRVGFVPCLFNITEPLMYSVPIVGNFHLFIPFVFVSVCNAIISYLCMSAGLIHKTYALLTWSLPSFAGAYLSTGDLKAGFLVIGLIVLDVLLWYPFFKTYENKLIKQESYNKNEGERS